MNLDIDEVTLILSGVEILQDLEIDTINDIAQQVTVAEFSAQELLVKQGQRGDHMFIIFNGKVEVCFAETRSSSTDRIILNKGAVVGEISLLTSQPYSADVVALTDTITLSLARPQFLKLIEQHKAFAETMTHLMSDRMAHNGEISRVGRYELLGKLGEGNMAMVFNAYDKELEREVAIKMLKYELSHDQKFLQRFNREAKIIASLNHPNIINVYEVIEEFSTSFIVMERLYGENLWDKLNDNGAFTINATREILNQIASALQYAHHQNIVHRDIKPSNIVIDDYGNIKLTDFGIAGPPQKEFVSVEGTPAYLAPEIINAESVDGRADIYAMGVMSFHLLTNSLPFSASRLNKILDMQVNQKPPEIKNYCPDIDDEFAEFIRRALEKDSGQRIADWDEIRRLLKSVIRKDCMELEVDEVGVVLKLKNTTYQQQALVIHSIQKLLHDNNVDHTLQILRGVADDFDAELPFTKD